MSSLQCPRADGEKSEEQEVEQAQQHLPDHDNGNEDDSDHDDDKNDHLPLLFPTPPAKQQQDETHHPLDSSDNDNAQISIPIRLLAWIVLSLLLASHLLLFRQCQLTYWMTQQDEYILGRYRVKEGGGRDAISVNLLGKATTHHHQDSTNLRDTLKTGDICEVLVNQMVHYDKGGNKDNAFFYRTIFPTAGLLPKTTLENDLEWIESYSTTTQSSSISTLTSSSPPYNSWCPLLFDGWWPDKEYTGWLPVGRRQRQYLYAPPILIVAQCLWNTLQVLQLYLLLALWYNDFDNNTSHIGRRLLRLTVRTLATLAVILLPFSVYVISLGGHMFAILTLLTTTIILMFWSPVSVLSISVGEEEEHDESISTPKNDRPRHVNDSNDANDDDGDSMALLVETAPSNTATASDVMELSTRSQSSSFSPSWLILTREETIAFLGNLFCHMYNARKPWYDLYVWVDEFFGFQPEVDVTPKVMYTMGLWMDNTTRRIPLFVSQSNHSLTDAYVFLLIWSILPFVYVSYFGIMYIVATKSPGVWLQRAVCIFGIINFLFLTDVVAYRYGRGYRSTHEDIFHWWEHFAWRAAIVLPLYQNCTNGHWAKHPNYPRAARFFRTIAAMYGVFFFIFQVIQCDVFRFVTFLVISHERSLFELLAWQDHPIVTWLNLNTPKTWATMIMTLLYAFLHISGYKLFQVSIRVQTTTSTATSGSSGYYKGLKTTDEDKEEI